MGLDYPGLLICAYCEILFPKGADSSKLRSLMTPDQTLL